MVPHVHIGFRTSGGRGEYEVVGSHSGYTAASLEGWSFFMRWPDGHVRDTGLWLDPAGSGKPRLRSLLKPEIQIGRIVAPMLLLPDPTRSFKGTPSSWPIVVEKQYTVTQVGFAPDSEFTGVTDRVTFVPSWVEVSNQGDSEAIGVAARWKRIQRIHDMEAELPEAVRSVLVLHRDALAAGTAVSNALASPVRALCRQLDREPRLTRQVGTDPLPSLEALLGITSPTEPDLPPPNELSEDEPEVNVRSAHQYRLAKIRGAAGRRFSEAVRAAYNHTCAFCGATYGGKPGIRSGVDAAHILAWSTHNLDVVKNGIALCKLHHWAFDAGVLLVRKEGAVYRLRFTTLADNFDSASLALVGVEGATIPAEWLPADPAQRPSQRYLDLTYADLGVTFRDSL